MDESRGREVMILRSPSCDEIAKGIHSSIIPVMKSMQGDLAKNFADFTDYLFSGTARNAKNQMLAMAACNCYLNKMLQTQNRPFLRFIEIG